jgi:hypothetical protein
MITTNCSLPKPHHHAENSRCFSREIETPQPSNGQKPLGKNQVSECATTNARKGETQRNERERKEFGPTVHVKD